VSRQCGWAATSVIASMRGRRDGEAVPCGENSRADFAVLHSRARHARVCCPLTAKTCSSPLGSANIFSMLLKRAATGIPVVSRQASLLTVRLVAFCDPISTLACTQHVSRDTPIRGATLVGAAFAAELAGLLRTAAGRLNPRADRSGISRGRGRAEGPATPGICNSRSGGRVGCLQLWNGQGE